jgi:hypothetical protein
VSLPAALGCSLLASFLAAGQHWHGGFVLLLSSIIHGAVGYKISPCDIIDAHGLFKQQFSMRTGLQPTGM